ncbi:hypothetical protein AMTR_s00171p00053780 [Amborella trichopoda]|uniref:Uncharacterized protein n=1 Tax=Amborella trichopoda TaxID=13333 RepID=W1PJT1_AMBTC|nr:hypothetical protein AMTR_s00171p00053780 [Amborella trichopoda]
MRKGLTATMRKHNSIKSIFGAGKKPKISDCDKPLENPIPQLSAIANSVVSRCSRILLLSPEQLQQQFETKISDNVKKPSSYARNLLEFCSYRALGVLTQCPDHLCDKDFRRLTFDMMLAWEDPAIGSESLIKEAPPRKFPSDDEDVGSLFYLNSISMAVQVDKKKTVGPEAFSRIAPACPAVADIITVHNLFDALTSSSRGQLHFLVYDKYLGSLDKAIKYAKSLSGPPLASSLPLEEGEIILDVDGNVPIQPVFQHIGISAWPGRLTLTNRALYFESLGVGLYDKPVKYDLSEDLKQVVKPDLTGPLGARLFDKAVIYKSTSVTEPVLMEFPEFKGHSRRDYWLEIIREVLHVNRFIRKFHLEDIPHAEALSKAILGIFRFRAVKEAFHIWPSSFKTPLTFNLAEKLPRGDKILEALSNLLELLSTGRSDDKMETLENATKHSSGSYKASSLSTLAKLGFTLIKEIDTFEKAPFLDGNIIVGETDTLELAVRKSKYDLGRAQAAHETVNQVKVEGIDTNLAVMMELLFPVTESAKQIHFLVSWEDTFKSTVFLVIFCYAIFWGWIKYFMPCIFLILASLMLWHKYRNKGKQLEAFKATDEAALVLIILTMVFMLVPLNSIIMLVFLEVYTREMPRRKASSEKLIRRLKEWWVRIPAAPVQLIKPEDDKKKE